MKKFIFSGLLISLLILLPLVPAVNASDVVSCTVSPQEVNLSVSNQVVVTIGLNNTQNTTANETVEISFPAAYLSCAECVKQVTMPPNSISSVWFTLQALSTTTAEQAITVTKPASYACPSILKIIAAADTTAPTVGSASPISVNAGQSTTFTASVSDNVGVVGCNFSFGNAMYQAAVSGNAASYSLSALEENYSAYFRCWDVAGNIGTGPSIVVSASKPKLSVSISLPKTTYYPTDSFEPRLTVADASGKFVVDASIKSNITGPKTYSPYFYYSALCDCYKGSQWFDEGTLVGNYSLIVTASHPSYQSTTATASFSVAKPSLQMTMSTDKTEYNPGDSIKVTAQIKDGLGNAITDGSVKAELRDADSGSLITTLHPQTKDNIYYYEYYVGAENLGKRYTISMSVKWKEQSASDSRTVLITKRGLNGEIVLEKDVLMPGDSLQGKVKVFDKNGNIIKDAKVNVEIKGSSYEKPGAAGKAEPTTISWLSSTYKDGFYEIEKWKIDDWSLAGNYTLSVRIDIGTENIVLEKKIGITKEKLNIQIILDQTSYAPSDRIYVKVLVTCANGSIVPNAYVSGEIFPLIQEVINETAGITGAATLVSPTAVTPRGEPTARCRIYILSPQGPLYYKGEYIQKSYIDDVYVPNDCPTGKYALRIRVGVPGYADTEVTKEFDVSLHKLHPSETTEKEKIEECTKDTHFEYNQFTKRYISKIFLGKYECPAGKYLIGIITSQPSYEAANIEQAVEINYSESEYNIVVPPAIGAPVCREISCGTNCINRICETPTPSQECHVEVSDKDCVRNCVDRAATTEKEAATITAEAVATQVSKAQTVEIGVPDCVKNCVKKMPCRGSAVTPPETQDMLAKLDAIQAEIKETHREIIETRQQVDVLAQWLKAIVDFINSIVASFGGGQVAPIQAPVSPTTP
ncbi:MAG: hypothetical protein HZB66_01545 [Candidatus Aenigmarchaeota archaeon]|nr:hypothetical protein [Candidatus Aenigmarchaeota archaeon]